MHLPVAHRLDADDGSMLNVIQTSANDIMQFSMSSCTIGRGCCFLGIMLMGNNHVA